MIVSPTAFCPTAVWFVNDAAYAFVISSLSGAPNAPHCHWSRSLPSLDPPVVKYVPSPFGSSTTFPDVPAGTHVPLVCVTHCGTNTRAVAPDCDSGGIAPPPTGGLMSFQSVGCAVAVPSSFSKFKSCTAHAGVPLTTSPTHTIRARPPHHPRAPRGPCSACAFLPILASPTPDTGSPAPRRDLMSLIHPAMPCPDRLCPVPLTLVSPVMACGSRYGHGDRNIRPRVQVVEVRVRRAQRVQIRARRIRARRRRRRPKRHVARVEPRRRLRRPHAHRDPVQQRRETLRRPVRVTRGGIDPVARVLRPPTVLPGHRCVRRPIRCRLPIDQRLRRPYRRPAGHAPARGHLVRLA